MKRNILIYFMTLTGLLILLSSCSSNTNDSSNQIKEDNRHQYLAENGDFRELTESSKELPGFLKDKPEQMQLIYAAAAQHQELLESIPCYCGCGDSADHRDNYDCFVYENKESGNVMWDDHGTRCGVCLETAAESIIQYKDGMSLKEIRQYIDEKYKEGYSKPTPTPFPS